MPSAATVQKGKGNSPPQASSNAAQIKPEAATSLLPPGIAAATAAPVRQVESGNAISPFHVSSTGGLSASMRRSSAAANVSIADTAKSSSRVDSSSDRVKNSDPPVIAQANNTPAAISTAPASKAAATQAPGMASPETVPPSATDGVSGNLSGVNLNALAGQASAPNSGTATPVLVRPDKPQNGGPATASGAPGPASTVLTAAASGFVKAMEGLTSAAEVGSPRDPNTPSGASTQASPRASEHDTGQATGTAAMDPDSIPSSDLPGLTQARVLHSLSGSEMQS